MWETIIKLIEHDPETAVRVIAVIVALIGARGIYQIIGRSSKDADKIRETLDRREERVHELEEDISDQAKEREELIQRLARAEAERDECRDRLSDNGIGSLSAVEEKTLREMVIRLKHENETLRSNQNQKGEYLEQ